MWLIVVLLSVLAAPHLGSGAPNDPLCSVVLRYDEINSATPHWSASFQIQTRQPLDPGSILDVKLAGSNDSSTLPNIVGITINGRNICPTEKVLTTIANFSTQSRSNTTKEVEDVTTMDDNNVFASTTDSPMDTTTDQPMTTEPTPS